MKHGPPLLRTIMSHQDRSAPLLYVPADGRSKMRFAAWQGGTPEIVSGFASRDAGRSTKGTGLSADARTTPSSGVDGPRCASVGPPVRRTPHASIESPAAAAATVAAPAMRAHSGHAARQRRRSGSATAAASSRVATPSFERISETWNFAVRSVMSRPSAICALLAPARSNSSTSHSRGVRMSG